MYSNDRHKQLECTVNGLREMVGYEECQKTLVVDGKLLTAPFEEWDIIEVPRINNKFCWSDMWEAGVVTAKNDIVFYLDSDRLLPKDYLERIKKYVQDDRFLFCSKHFLVCDPDFTFEQGKIFLKDFEEDPEIFLKDDMIGKLRYEVRHQNPVQSAGKNVMSGNTVFTQKTFYRLGGVDRYYRGHGAFADTDFHQQAYILGCDFYDLGCAELHYHHSKLEDKNVLDNVALNQMSLDNFIYYCYKWKLSSVHAKNLAFASGIVRNPDRYVDDKIQELKDSGFKRFSKES